MQKILILLFVLFACTIFSTVSAEFLVLIQGLKCCRSHSTTRRMEALTLDPALLFTRIFSVTILSKRAILTFKMK